MNQKLYKEILKIFRKVENFRNKNYFSPIKKNNSLAI